MVFFEVLILFLFGALHGLARPQPPGNSIKDVPVRSFSKSDDGSAVEVHNSDADVVRNVPVEGSSYNMIHSLKFKAGDILQEEVTGRLILAVSKSLLIRLPRGKVCWVWTTTVLTKKTGWLSRARVITPKSNVLTNEKRVALGERFMKRKLPYGWWSCNEHHYENYLYFGKTTRNRIFSHRRGCPLARDLTNVDEQHIKSDSFYLLDGRNRRIFYPTGRLNQEMHK